MKVYDLQGASLIKKDYMHACTAFSEILKNVHNLSQSVILRTYHQSIPLARADSIYFELASLRDMSSIFVKTVVNLVTSKQEKFKRKKIYYSPCHVLREFYKIRKIYRQIKLIFTSVRKLMNKIDVYIQFLLYRGLGHWNQKFSR